MIGITTPNSASRTISSGLSRLLSDTSPYSPNRKQRPNSMNRFHSIGTPIANVEKMWRWNISIPMRAMVPSVPPSETIKSSGMPNSHAVPR